MYVCRKVVTRSAFQTFIINFIEKLLEFFDILLSAQGNMHHRVTRRNSRHGTHSYNDTGAGGDNSADFFAEQTGICSNLLTFNQSVTRRNVKLQETSGLGSEPLG